jgi:hypothetical protein
VDRVINGQRVLSDGKVHHPGADERVSRDPQGYPPSQDQFAPAIAYSPHAGHALVVWQDTGHHDPDTDDGIWGRLWVPTERVLLPLVIRTCD